jgi:hypothetical protein
MNFDDYIQQLLGNRNPQGNMLTGVSTTPNFYNQAQNNDYYDNRFRKQDSIDAAMAKKLADEQALAQQLGLSNAGGMMSGGGGGDSEVSLTPDQIAYFDEETLDEQGARIKNDLGWLVEPIAGLLGGPIGYGLTKGVNTSSDFNGHIRTPDAIRQQIQLQQSLMADEQRKRESAQVAMAEEANRAAINAQAASRMRRQEGVGGGGGGESNMSYGGSTGSNVGTSNPNSYSSSRSSGSS